MTVRVHEWERGLGAAALAEIAAFWNENAAGRHAFFPWTGERLASLLTDDSGRDTGKILTVRSDAGVLMGFTHVARRAEDGYPRSGVVEALLVGRDCRRRGVGSALLQAALAELARPGPGRGEAALVDAMGAWPHGYAYTTLADGSERSGVFLEREPELYRLFRSSGFAHIRPSTVMRVQTRSVVPRPLPAGAGCYVGRRTERTWLDRVFRGREIWDHDLARDADGRVMSRAIFGFMDGESAREGQAIFSIFGVNTPLDVRGRGYAGVNLSHLIRHVGGLGADVVELHVYGDNPPALRLYRGLGFTPVAETMMMHQLRLG